MYHFLFNPGDMGYVNVEDVKTQAVGHGQSADHRLGSTGL
jgi:hypothetical protein